MQIIENFPRHGIIRATQMYWRNIKGSRSSRDDWILWKITINYLMMEKYPSVSGFSATQTWIVWNLYNKGLASKGFKEYYDIRGISIKVFWHYFRNMFFQGATLQRIPVKSSVENFTTVRSQRQIASNSEFSYVTQGLVTPVKNQKLCGKFLVELFICPWKFENIKNLF